MHRLFIDLPVSDKVQIFSFNNSDPRNPTRCVPICSLFQRSPVEPHGLSSTTVNNLLVS